MSNSRCAVILAAGRGSRMGSLTDNLPKPLLPVAGVPSIVRVILSLKEAGITEFVIVVGYLGHMVRDALGDGNKWNVSIKYVEQPIPLGTGHALALTETAVSGNDVLLAFADIQTGQDNYAALITRYAQGDCAGTAALRDVVDPWRAAAVYMDTNNQITRIVEKPALGSSTTRWAHAGGYCLSNRIFKYLKRIKPSERNEIEVTSAVQLMIESSEKLIGVPWTGYWSDLAGPDDLQKIDDLLSLRA